MPALPAFAAAPPEPARAMLRAPPLVGVSITGGHAGNSSMYIPATPIEPAVPPVAAAMDPTAGGAATLPAPPLAQAVDEAASGAATLPAPPLAQAVDKAAGG